MDPLSDVLSLLRVKAYWSAGFDFGENWAVSSGPYEGIKFYAVISGDAWLRVDGVKKPVHVAPGDCLLLPRGRPFVVARDLKFKPIDPIKEFAGRPKDGGIVVMNGGGHFFGLGGEFSLTGGQAQVLLGVLPPIVHIRDEAGKAAMHSVIERIRLELRSPQPGGAIVAQQMATLLLVQTLRLHLADGLNGGVGWLFALADRQMAAAMSAMHEHPGAAWTVESLASRAGMSRTAFAIKFKRTVGSTPLDYLTRWRMTLACDRLVRTTDPVSEIGMGLGYESQSAFGLAFKRVVGVSPGKYGRGRGMPMGSPHQELAGTR